MYFKHIELKTITFEEGVTNITHENFQTFINEYYKGIYCAG